MSFLRQTELFSAPYIQYDLVAAVVRTHKAHIIGFNSFYSRDAFLLIVRAFQRITNFSNFKRKKLQLRFTVVCLFSHVHFVSSVVIIIWSAINR